MEFDVIVIGGGSAGSAVAGRLSEDPKVSVCLIEAGGRNNDFRVKTPAMLPFLPDKVNWHFATIPQKGLNGRIGRQPRGKGLGGSSAINAMVYIRGNPYDYDNWAQNLGCPGWAWADVLPWFIRSEGNGRYGRDPEFDLHHSSSGPLSVSDQSSANILSKSWVEAAAQLQLPINGDFNGGDQAGFGMYQVTQKNGERWSAARAYLEPHRKRDNLTILTNCLVEKILIEQQRATGVYIQRGRSNQTIRAKHSVVLSAGAFGSPQILMLSGVGPADHLRSKYIAPILDQPQVGQNLQDHIDYVAGFETDGNESFGTSLAGTVRMAKGLIEYQRKRTGVFTSCFAESGGFWYADRAAPAPDLQFHFVPALLEDHGQEKVEGHGFSVHVCALRPESIGEVSLRNDDPKAAPHIDPNFLADARDLAVMREGVRLIYRMVGAPALARYAPKDRHPVDVRDDDALDQIIRNRADTVYHPVGTCRMGMDQAAVVDPELRLKGIEGLYVADASIMPKIISGNTNAPSIMIGERCADFIGKHMRAA